MAALRRNAASLHLLCTTHIEKSSRGITCSKLQYFKATLAPVTLF